MKYNLNQNVFLKMLIFTSDKISINFASTVKRNLLTSDKYFIADKNIQIYTFIHKCSILFIKFRHYQHIFLYISFAL